MYHVIMLGLESTSSSSSSSSSIAAKQHSLEELKLFFEIVLILSQIGKIQIGHKTFLSVQAESLKLSDDDDEEGEDDAMAAAGTAVSRNSFASPTIMTVLKTMIPP